MAATALRHEERIGLALALAAHVALVALLVWQPGSRPVVVPPERMTVTISDEVGLKSTSPEPAAQAAPDVAPDLGDPAPAEPEPQPEPRPVARPEPPKPQPPRPLPPKPVARPVPAPPPPRPAARPAPPPRPAPKAAPTPPRATPARATPARAAPPRAQAQTAQRPARNPGASRIGDDFLKGPPAAQNATGQSRNPPAQTIGPAVQASLAGAISRQLKPKWAAPQGVDADKLVTVLAWNLNRDGTLAGAPRVVRQDGVNDANRAQAQRHAEQAIRAVQLAAPFDLPEEYYDAWKRVATFRFDRRLSQ